MTELTSSSSLLITRSPDRLRKHQPSTSPPAGDSNRPSPISIYSSCDSISQFDSVSLAPTLISDHPLAPSNPFAPLQRVRSIKETAAAQSPSPRAWRTKASAPAPPDSPLPPAPSLALPPHHKT